MFTAKVVGFIVSHTGLDRGVSASVSWGNNPGHVMARARLKTYLVSVTAFEARVLWFCVLRFGVPGFSALGFG